MEGNAIRCRRACLLAGALVWALAGAAKGQSAVEPEAAPWRPSETDGWSVQWPAGLAKVTYLGLLSHDGVGLGPAGAMLYPAPNFGGFIAAVLTHAALNEGAKSAQRAAVQANANKVLDDYRTTIDGYDPAELVQRVGLALAVPASAPPSPVGLRWALEVRPVFWMTQDRRALIVDNELTVKEGSEGPVVRRSAVRVVGTPLPADGASDAWAHGQGELLKQQSAVLLARAVRLSMDDLADRWGKEARHRTVRFPEGGDERIERAQLLGTQCGRAVIRNLRGDLMDVPLPSAADAAECATAPPATGALSAPAAAREN